MYILHEIFINIFHTVCGKFFRIGRIQISCRNDNICLPGTVLALLFPNWNFYPVIHFITLEGFLFHMGIVLYVAGDEVEVDFDSGIITDVTTGKKFQGQAFPPFMQKIIDCEGLVNYINQK